MLELLMQQLNPTAVFPAQQSTTLSQPVVLALLHQLGLDIQQCSLPQQQQRFLWIQNALNHLNVKVRATFPLMYVTNEPFLTNTIL
jgi:hypothetical protein